MQVLNKLSKIDLFNRCKELKLKNYSSLNKDKLIKLIEETANLSQEQPLDNEVVKPPTSLAVITLQCDADCTFTQSERNCVREQTTNNDIEIKHMEGIEYLKIIDNNSVNLILTDPPYIISKESGMNAHYNNVKTNEENNIEFVKSEQDWLYYRTENAITDDSKKENYMKYGTIYGKKYCVKTNYGDWDSNFTIEKLDEFIGEYYKKLKKGGTLIIFFDLWKITLLKDIMEKHKFKQIRFIEWIKTNPQPRNSNVNYLTNCREIALLGIKDGNPTFNSTYDNGIYKFPLQGGKNRFHPTQKSLVLFEELIKKHSNKGDLVLDTFLGAGTTAIACKKTNRKFKGCEIAKEYYDKIIQGIV
jgi:site-specific DNA-methyltransferase (adenine-specific)